MKNKILLVLVVIAMVASVVSQDAYAWGGRGGRYYWHGGRWYNNSWFWFGAGMTALALGSVVASLPPYYNTVYYGGVPYYYYDGIYYQSSPYGYTVVQAPPMAAPAVVQQPYVQQPYTVAQPAMYAPSVESANIVQTTPQNTQGESFTVNVPNYKGSYTPVTMTRSGTGFTGPQGEYYADFPKIKQLKEMYGK